MNCSKSRPCCFGRPSVADVGSQHRPKCSRIRTVARADSPAASVGGRPATQDVPCCIRSCCADGTCRWQAEINCGSSASSNTTQVQDASAADRGIRRRNAEALFMTNVVPLAKLAPVPPQVPPPMLSCADPSVAPVPIVSVPPFAFSEELATLLVNRNAPELTVKGPEKAAGPVSVSVPPPTLVKPPPPLLPIELAKVTLLPLVSIVPPPPLKVTVREEISVVLPLRYRRVPPSKLIAVPAPNSTASRTLPRRRSHWSIRCMCYSRRSRTRPRPTFVRSPAVPLPNALA